MNDVQPHHGRGTPVLTSGKGAAIATAVLFDVDGTLVDSNHLHVHARCRAFHEAGPDELELLHTGSPLAALLERR